MNIPVLFGVVAVVGVGYYLYSKRGASTGDGKNNIVAKIQEVYKKTIAAKSKGSIKINTVEETDFSNIVGFFKSLHLDSQKDIPFIADLRKGEFDLKELVVVSDDLLRIEGCPVVLLLGVYNEENDQVANTQILCAKKLDEKTHDVLGEESLVRLS